MKDCISTSFVQHGGILVLLVAVLLCLAPCAWAGDFEYWPKAAFTIPIDEQWQFYIEERLSVADDVRRLDDHQTDFAVTYLGLADWLSVGVGYKAFFEKDGDNWWVEDRPYLNVAVKAKIHGFGVTDRSRFEYRIPEDEDEVWQYRHKLTITSPTTFTPWKVLPYVAEEVFISFDEEDFNQQRVYTGFFIPLHKQVRLELFYLWRLDKEDDDWHDTNVLGSWLYFQFY